MKLKKALDTLQPMRGHLDICAAMLGTGVCDCGFFRELQARLTIEALFRGYPQAPHNKGESR